MSDSIIIQAVYIAIGPFFVADSGGEADGGGAGGGKGTKKESVIIKTLGKSAMRGLRLDALSLIRSVCALFFFCSWVVFVINALGFMHRFLRIMKISVRGSSRRY